MASHPPAGGVAEEGTPPEDAAAPAAGVEKPDGAAAAPAEASETHGSGRMEDLPSLLSSSGAGKANA